jgi:C4-dicarboxylate-specific signal transduction histidine kinase
VIRKKFVLGLLIVLVAGAAVLYFSGRSMERQAAQQLAREALGRLSQERAAIEDFHRRHGRLPKDAAELGLTQRPSSMFVREVRYAQGELTAVLQGAGSRYEGKTVRYKAQPGAQTLTWRCYAGEGFPADALPACRAP